MKTLFFILSFCRFAISEEGDDEIDDNIYEEYPFSFPPNTTFIENTLSAPCDVSAPGFRRLGIMVAYLLVFVFSLLGNSLVVFVVCNMRRGRASTDIYLMNLAVADLLFSLTLPFWAVEAHYGWVFGNSLCKVFSGFQEVCGFSGVFLLACISVDRYFAIVHAKRHLSSHTLRVKVVCAVVWFVAGMLALPVAQQRESLHVVELDQYICYENFTHDDGGQWRVNVLILRHTVGFFLPLTVMGICYSCTMAKLFHARNQQKHKAMRVILAVVFAFIVCWLPFNVSVLIDTLIREDYLVLDTCEPRYTVEKMVNVTQVLAFTHCMVNPVLYAFIGQKFRNQLLSALYKRRFISQKVQQAYRTGSVNSSSLRSRNTSVTL